MMYYQFKRLSAQVLRWSKEHEEKANREDATEWLRGYDRGLASSWELAASFIERILDDNIDQLVGMQCENCKEDKTWRQLAEYTSPLGGTVVLLCEECSGSYQEKGIVNQLTAR